ncbi:hypothetical protein C2I33_01855 [Ralstonia solanacearum]|nr:hypothetical protein CQ06_21750 [Ralstonia solanacearum]KFX29504.1 hypothetical protein KR96_07735 [Ralstonia solanacearum]KFX78505.1 hypothetical protein KR98_13620 [Ralstonia solanacearum]KFX82193.1 hypothetical protein KR99_18820 [Ralstonia solanacearum]OCQ75134.1 hypothetical protein AR466_11710 [Ralstonia solanacearum]
MFRITGRAALRSMDPVHLRIRTRLSIVPAGRVALAIDDADFCFGALVSVRLASPSGTLCDPEES